MLHQIEDLLVGQGNKESSLGCVRRDLTDKAMATESSSIFPRWPENMVAIDRMLVFKSVLATCNIEKVHTLSSLLLFRKYL